MPIIEETYSGDDFDSVRRAISTLLRNDVELARAPTRSIVLTLDSFNLGGTPPTAATVGTTPTMPVLLFDATAEIANVFLTMPSNWDKAEDIVINLVWSLVSTEVNADELSITVDYVAVSENTTAAGLGKTSTQLTPTLAVSTANGLAVGDIYIMSVTLDKNDTNNGFSVGDDVVGIGFEFHMTNLTNIASIHLVGANVNYGPLY